jgi:hypothetical protein
MWFVSRIRRSDELLDLGDLELKPVEPPNSLLFPTRSTVGDGAPAFMSLFAIGGDS